MAVLPTVGGSLNTWGTELNAWAAVEHNTDGTHKAVSLQGGAVLYSGAGVPSNATGVDGDWYFRKGGAPGSRLYQRVSGVWQSITEGSISVQDEGIALGSVATFNFSGVGVTASVTGGVATVTIPGGSAGNLGVGVFNVIDYSGSFVTQCRAAYAACVAAGGGTVLIPPGSYTANDVGTSSVFALARDNAGTNRRVTISAYGAKITFTTNTPRYCDFNRQANNDIFRNHWICGGGLNFNSITGVGNDGHMVIGTQPAGNLQLNIGVQDFLIEDLIISGLYTDTTWPSRTNGQFAIDFAAAEDGSATSAGTLYKNITIRRCKISGGLLGAAIAGATPNGLHRGVNCWIEDCEHDTGVIPSAFFPATNFHIGSYGRYTNSGVRRCIGKGSGDDGIETNGADPLIVVEDCHIEDAWQCGYAYINFSTPTNNDQSRMVYNRCHFRLVSVTNVGSCMFTTTNVGTADQRRVEMYSCSVSDERTTLIAQTFSGININSGSTLRELIIRDFTAVKSGWTWNPGVAAQAYATLHWIEINGAGSRLLIDGMRVVVRGTQTTAGATNAVFVFPVIISPTAATQRVVVRNVEYEFNVTNHFAGTSEALSLGMGYFGEGAGAVRQAEISGIHYVSTTDTQGNGVAIGSSTNLAIGNRVLVEKCDFSAITTSSNELTAGDATNRAKVRSQNIVWSNGTPKAPSSITVPASGTGWRNEQMVAGTVVSSGGTVSVIAKSTNGGTTYTTLAGTTGNFHLEPGDLIRWTYTGTPTATFVPDS